MRLNAIKRMEIYARNHPEVVSLSQGIPYLKSDDCIREGAVKAITDKGVDFYSDPQGIVGLRRLISEKLREEGIDYGEEEIIVTAGATEGISAILLGLLTRDRDEVIVPTPTYSAYFRIVEMARGRVVELKLEEERDWELDLAAIKKSITKKTGVIMLCNPNNPTGSIYSKTVLREICLLAKKNNVIVLIDEVYRNMIFDESTYYTPCEDEEFKQNIVRVVSFSKDFSLTGWRVGFIHSSDKLIKRILPVHDSLINCVPVISQYAAIAALENMERILTKNHKIYYAHRSIMSYYLDQLSDFFTYYIPRGSYFFFPRFIEEENSEQFCLDLLQKQRVAVVPGSDFGVGGENHIRLCFGRSEGDIHNGMKRMMRFFENRRQFAYGI